MTVTSNGQRVIELAAGAFVGLVAATIVILNLHIVVGLEQGYAATPGEVLDLSVLLALVDLVLLVGGPITGAITVRRLRRR